MKLVSYSIGSSAITPGILLPDLHQIIDLNDLGYPTLLSYIEAGLPAVDSRDAISADLVRLHAPLPKPPRIFAIGLNYRDHARESGMAIPTTPVVFFKLATSVIGPGDAIILPKNSTMPDWEAEFAFVIGKGGYRIPGSAWRDHVCAYTNVNDVSARDVQFSSTQWSMSKSFPTFCPLGPYLVTADEIEDPHNLDISLTIDGERMQHSNTRELVFKIPDLVEYLSSITPLLPGDIVSTGTPPGVGLGQNPKRWLKAGETVSVTVQGLGTLTNPLVAE
ncbi:fumarylacetoacetate hydrolase family protein [Acidobacteria bacterium AB60]|nr:fumarylacetoacetate hydrolase family protein [Acidobacteria bacterium AB60]